MHTYNIRASALGEILDCAMRFEAKHLLGKTNPTSPAAALGSAVHASTAVFDTAKMNGVPVSAPDTVGVMVDALHHPEYPVDWSEITPQSLEPVGIELHTRYCLEVSPQYTYRAVELAVGELDITVNGVIIKLTGRMDRSRVREGEKGVGINDLKTGKRAINKDGVANTKGHAAQIGVYELLTEMKTGEDVTLPAQIIGLQTTKTTKVGIGEIVGAKSMLIGAKDEPGLLEFAAVYLEKGMFPPNPRSMLCSAKYCPIYPCKYAK